MTECAQTYVASDNFNVARVQEHVQCLLTFAELTMPNMAVSSRDSLHSRTSSHSKVTRI